LAPSCISHRPNWALISLVCVVVVDDENRVDCVKTGENEQWFRRESYTQNDTAELTLGRSAGRCVRFKQRYHTDQIARPGSSGGVSAELYQSSSEAAR
jgi:hypothetical protein